jgi:hypothetical protein
VVARTIRDGIEATKACTTVNALANVVTAMHDNAAIKRTVRKTKALDTGIF